MLESAVVFSLNNGTLHEEVCCFIQRHFDGGLVDSLCKRVVAPLEVPKVASYQSHYQGTRSPIAVGKFDNRSSYMRGIFSDGVDRLGSQAKTVLITHLQQTGRFSVLDRDNMEEIKAEAGIKQQAQQLKGADYVVTGDVTEFGRKEVGDHQLFGILGRGKSQIAYAKVNLNMARKT